MSNKFFLLTLLVAVLPNLLANPSVWADQQTLKVYRTVDANGLVSFSDQQVSGATAIEVHTHQPDKVAVESSADSAALTAEIADQMAEQRLERLSLLAEDRAVRASRRASTNMGEQPDAEDSDSSAYTNRGGYYGAYPRPPLRPYLRPDVPTVTTEVGEHFKAGWPGRLHPFGPAGTNNRSRSNER